MDLKNRVGVITGAASGIGKEIAITFAREGARVAIADLDLKAAEGAAHEIDSTGHRVIGVAMDVSDDAQVDAGMAGVVLLTPKVPSLDDNLGLHGFQLQRAPLRRTIALPSLAGIFGGPGP